jgi:predicted nuclease of predicted toxin-antitoxin system
VKILLDMNLSPSWVPFLEFAGVRAVHWSTLGDPRAHDRELMDWARSNGCVVFTNDLDFSALLAITRGAGPSVLQIRTQDLLPAAIGGTVVRVLAEHRAALLDGAILTVDDRGSRVRVLPLKSSPG